MLYELIMGKTLVEILSGPHPNPSPKKKERG